MPYNFDELTERRGTGSMKWDVPEGDFPCGWRIWILRQPRKSGKR